MIKPSPLHNLLSRANSLLFFSFFLFVASIASMYPSGSPEPKTATTSTVGSDRPSVPYDQGTATTWFPFLPAMADSDGGITSAKLYGLQEVAGSHGPIYAKDGHLWAGNQRIRFLGSNLTFAAALPTHQDADLLAARLARFGVNVIRLHHMDSQPSPSGLFLKDKINLDPVMLDRLDYLAFALAKQGIYTDLNLHVGRMYPGLPVWQTMPQYFKGVDQFSSLALQEQKTYAKALLSHINPYTGLSWAKDPAVAFVEINNENGLIREWKTGGLEDLPEPLADEFSARWRAWLRAHYQSDEQLSKAWQPAGALTNDSVTVAKTPQKLLVNEDFANGTNGWTLQISGNAKASIDVISGPETQKGLEIKTTQVSAEPWHVQLYQSGLAVVAGQGVTLDFWAKSNASQSMSVVFMQASSPWQRRWWSNALLGNEWKHFHFVWCVEKSEKDLRINFGNLGDLVSTVQIAGISMATGPIPGLLPGETMADNKPGSLSWFSLSLASGRTLQARTDWAWFLYDTEKSYWTGMYRYLKNELGVLAQVVGTQALYSPATIQAELDVVDNHAYWMHPRFPHKPWDPVDWWQGSEGMSGLASAGTMKTLASQRIAGKPYIITEYNHPAPNPARAETVPLLASMAMLQDWDGVFIYEWSSRPNANHAQTMERYFDIDADPVRLLTMPFAKALLQFGLGENLETTLFTQDFASQLAEIEKTGTLAGANSVGLDPLAVFRSPVAFATSNQENQARSTLSPLHTTSSLRWETADASKGQTGNGHFLLDTPWAAAFSGTVGGKLLYPRSGVSMTVPGRIQGATVLCWSVDGKKLDAKGTKLVEILADARNSEENPYEISPGKITVGKNWGKAPVLAEGLEADISFPVAPSHIKAWALDAEGKRSLSLPLKQDGNNTSLSFSPQYRTLWYEVEID